MTALGKCRSLVGTLMLNTARVLVVVVFMSVMADAFGVGMSEGMVLRMKDEG